MSTELPPPYTVTSQNNNWAELRHYALGSSRAWNEAENQADIFGLPETERLRLICAFLLQENHQRFCDMVKRESLGLMHFTKVGLKNEAFSRSWPDCGLVL